MGDGSWVMAQRTKASVVSVVSIASELSLAEGFLDFNCFPGEKPSQPVGLPEPLQPAFDRPAPVFGQQFRSNRIGETLFPLFRFHFSMILFKFSTSERSCFRPDFVLTAIRSWIRITGIDSPETSR